MKRILQHRMVLVRFSVCFIIAIILQLLIVVAIAITPNKSSKYEVNVVDEGDYYWQIAEWGGFGWTAYESGRFFPPPDPYNCCAPLRVPHWLPARHPTDSFNRAKQLYIMDEEGHFAQSMLDYSPEAMLLEHTYSTYFINEWQQFIGIGFPFHCVYGNVDTTIETNIHPSADLQDVRTESEHFGVILLDRSDRRQWGQGREIPILPIWTGLSANILLTGIAIFGVVQMLRFGHRRLRTHHGRCPKCGYDLRGQTQPGCPECGRGRT